jgi:hypothetical protein
MNGPWAKLIPTAALIAIIGYLSLPYFDASPANTAPPAKRLKLAADDLRPTAPPGTERDPFGGSVRFEMGDAHHEESGRITKGNQPTGGKLGQALPSPSGGAAAKTAASEAKMGKAAAGDPTKLSATEVKTADRTANTDLVLTATLLHGEQRHALINGRSYQPGEVLDGPDSQTPYTVAEIHHHHVVLERDGSRVDLNYPDESVGPKPAAAGRAGNPKNARIPGAGGPRGPSPPPRSNKTVRAPQAR